MHEIDRSKDAIRDAYMRDAGIEVLRITVARFERHPEGVVEQIRKTAERRAEKKQ